MEPGRGTAVTARGRSGRIVGRGGLALAMTVSAILIPRVASGETEAERAYLTMAATIYTAYLTCPGGLDPDPTETVAALGQSYGVEPRDVAPEGRLHPTFRSIIVGLAQETKGQAPADACALLVSRYPRWIKPATRPTR